MMMSCRNLFSDVKSLYGEIVLCDATSLEKMRIKINESITKLTFVKRYRDSKIIPSFAKIKHRRDKKIIPSFATIKHLIRRWNEKVFNNTSYNQVCAKIQKTLVTLEKESKMLLTYIYGSPRICVDLWDDIN